MSIEQKEQIQLNWLFIAFIIIFFPIIILLAIFVILIKLIASLFSFFTKKSTKSIEESVPFYKKIWKSLKLTSDSLDKQNLFWIAIITPIIYFVIIGVIAWMGTDVNVNYQGFNKFLEISKLPLGILALSPILGVIVSNIHRTIQTEKQILVTEQKNISDSFYSHYKFITDEFKDISFSMKVLDEDIKIESISAHSTYRKFFKDANPKQGAPDKADKESIEYLSKILDEFIEIYLDREQLNTLSGDFGAIIESIRNNSYQNTLINIQNYLFKILDELNYEITPLKLEVESIRKQEVFVNCLHRLQISVNTIMNRMLGIVDINDSNLNYKMNIFITIINVELGKLRPKNK